MLQVAETALESPEAETWRGYKVDEKWMKRGKKVGYRIQDIRTVTGTSCGKENLCHCNCNIHESSLLCPALSKFAMVFPGVVFSLSKNGGEQALNWRVTALFLRGS